jgi:HEAT repeat protein
MALEPGEAVDDVLKLFSHEDASVRKSAVSLVGHWKHKRSMPVVTAMLRDPDALVRVEAVEALASMGATDASGLVAERLEDEAETVRSRAAVALGRLGAKSHSGKIADFGREGRLTKTAAAEALLLLDARDKSAAIVDLLEAMAQAEAGKPGRGDVVEDRSRKPSFTDLVMLACRKEMNDCVVDLLKRIEKNIPAFRTGVLYAVSESGNSALLKRLGEEGLLVSKEAQHNALRAYEKTLTAETIPALMDLVRTLDESVQRHLGLVERRLSEFPEKVAPFTEDKSPAVRRLAGLALCNSRQVKHLPRLMKLMEDLDTNVRASITQSAAFMPSTDHHELIGRRLADPEAWVRRAAVSGVWWLRLNRFTPNVVGLLADPDPITVETVLYALEFLDIKDQSARIVPLLDNPKWAARAADLLRKSGAAEAVKPLLKLAKEGAPEARAAAIRALAVLGGKDRVSDLDALLADKEDEIRAAGAFAVGVFKDSGRKEAVIALLKDPRHVVKAEAATALAELGARDQAAGIVALLDLPDEQPIQVTAGGHKSSRYMAEEAAAAALVKFNAVESAPDLARLLKASKDSFATQRLAFALIRLAPKRYLEEILSSHVQGWKLGALYEVNRAKAPRLYAKIGAAPPADPRCLERGLLERRAERFGQVFGVKILIDPAVPDAIRRSEEAAAMPGRTAHQLFTSIIPLGCSAIFDDDTGEARIVTLEEAKRFWLDWAKEPK